MPMANYKGFTSVELRKAKRSKFDLSHEKRLSTRMGRLTPVFVSETLPNDTFHCNTEVMLRLAPLLAPIFHRVNVYVHFFFVPNRIIADWWEPFITGGRLGAEVTTPPVPSYFQVAPALGAGLELLNTGSLADYLGVPPIPDADSGLWSSQRIDCLPFAAYQRIWYDYYRDRNFVLDDTIFPLAAGNNDTNAEELLTLRTRAWEHDYFTSAQLTTQRGAEVLMPLEGSGTVEYLPEAVFTGGNNSTLSTNIDDEIIATTGGATGSVVNIDEVILDSSNVSINDLRRAVRLQEWMERNQLAGSRYNESIMAHFNRKTSDARLQRAEYLGGGKIAVSISEVVTTAFSQDSSDATVPAGNMAGHGISLGKTNHFSYNCEEHGIILGIMSVMPTSAYMQGIPRMFTKRETFLDYPWPTFAHLGEQEVWKSELYMTPSNMNVDVLFGYQSRYADWKYISSSSHGDFRESLDFWHITRKFSSQPSLGEEFVTFEDALQDRIFAVSGVDTLWCYIYNNCSVVRSLPYFGTPML